MVSIPTYGIGKPEKNPMFLENRVYQGSSGVVYPHPVVEKISDTKTDRKWLACFLENHFLKIMILPELGGRVQMAFDKTMQRHFVYHNEVIKPALVGLTGPWISGGIEFNWPQHHRPSTFDPVDFTIEENPDGSKTVWCSEIERMSRTRGMAGFTLHPAKSYLEIKVRLYNRTSQPQTFLWWANPAVAVNDHYQSVFPPDVHAVFDHGKRDVSEFPIARGTYYKVDYSGGVDISRYKNIPVPTSYMAIQSSYDFVGGYENDSKGGLLHVANHHISPGKKQWTWGNGDFGKAWDKRLTERNGPYIELMCGVYTDNQPDFSWLMPYEEKSFSQYFMPYRDLGIIKNATKEAMLNLEFNDRSAVIKVYSTGIYNKARIILTGGGEIIFSATLDLSPTGFYSRDVLLEKRLPDHEYQLSVNDVHGNELVSWRPEKLTEKPIPEAAKKANAPQDITSIEELFLTGLHLEQYRHASFNPADYYAEGIRRDPDDSRCNNAMGMWLLRRGQFANAESHFRVTCRRLIQRNPNPYDGEPFFNLGLSLRFQGREDEAYEAFHKSVWNAAFMDPGYFQIALIDAGRKEFNLAIDNVSRSLNRNWHNHKARHLKVALLRRLAQNETALDLCADSLKIDRFNFGIYYEQYLLGDQSARDSLTELLRDNIHNYLEISLDYAWAGMYEEAISIINLGIEQNGEDYPMAYYYRAWFQFRSGRVESVKISLKAAEECPPDYCFPNHLEAIPALQLAIKLNPGGARAPYYLGNFWFHSRQYEEALASFEKSIDSDDQFPTTYRNLSLLYYNHFEQQERALSSMERAFELDPGDARILIELIQLHGKMKRPVRFRIEMLERYPDLVDERDDLYLEKINLHILEKSYQKAYDLVMSRNFHPWEGGEGKVAAAYTSSLIGLARRALEFNNFPEAIEFLEKAKTYPENLGEGKLYGTMDNGINYWLGYAYQRAGESSLAKEAWTKASLGLTEPAAAMYYNDQPPDAIYYQGLSLEKLGNDREAQRRFNKLLEYGKAHLKDLPGLDYFAVSLPDMQIWNEDLPARNRIHCHYMMALAYKAKKMPAKASHYFSEVLKADPSHAGAMEHIENQGDQD